MRTGSIRLQAASVLLISVLPFAFCLDNRPVWDDNLLLNQRLARVEDPFHLWQEPWFGGDAYRPLGLPFIYLEKATFGDWIPGFHLVSILLHATTSLVLLRLLRRIVAEHMAWIAAILFAIHPVHAEAVAMIYGQTELLMALFGLLALDQYVQSVQDVSRSHRHLAAALVLAFLSACSKESGLMLPILVVLLSACYVKTHEPLTSRWLNWRQASFLVPALAYVALRIAMLNSFYNPPTPPITSGYSFTMRIKTIIVALGSQVRLSIFPTGQSLYYGHLRDSILGRPWPELAWISAAGLVCMSIAKEIGWKPVAFATGWFLITLLPVLNIFPSLVLVGERNLYLPLVGVVFLTAAIAVRQWPFGPGASTLAVALVLLCVVDANAVVCRWRDSESLWRSTVRDHPTSPMAHVWLGETLLGTPGHESEAEEQFRKALALNPDLLEARQGLENSSSQRKDHRIH